ncbi:hypothetical protein [Protaetiibacter intestinalis]|uniref:Uncharacterized protein n=1 Tax=Protaetiibacter intestinalis TaxID=2419774 RepID=A0A387B7S0_9MICO|nr:hypothetical protein [Protaetiibacter intestinalis]AYF97841.1 hypothetical protein D7I47_05925 [Protaetiibacter intestinalis]
MAVVLLAVLSGCATPDPRKFALESAQANFQGFDQQVQEQLPDLPTTGFRDFVVQSHRFGGAGSLIDLTEAEIREDAYSLQYGTTRILEASQDDDIATVLGFVSGYYETGGGWSYKQATVFSCFTVSLDLDDQRVLGFDDADCTDAIYAVTSRDDEVPFSELVPDLSR